MARNRAAPPAGAGLGSLCDDGMFWYFGVFVVWRSYCLEISCVHFMAACVLGFFVLLIFMRGGSGSFSQGGDFSIFFY